MRPLKLRMCAFGPYKTQVEIDFEKLGKNGIFLITGDTGSGKTTIFDAISFALFGVSSGSRRDNSILRSDFASDDVKTFVELEFIHKDIFYKIERIPRYMRKKIRGSGSTTVGGDANLTFLNEVITGDKSVTDKCIEILGINSNQFKQIVMIAQGEFMELLLAKPRDRAEIFRKIFDTNIYKNISDVLKDRYLLKKQEYNNVLIELNNYKKGIICDYEIDDNICCSLLLDMLNKYNEEIKNKEYELKEKKALIEKEYETILKKLNEADLVNNSIKSLKEFRGKLSSLIVNEDLYLKKEKLLKKNKEIIEKIIPNYNELKRLEKVLNEKKESYKENSKLFDEISIKYKNICKKYKNISNLEEELEKLKKDKDNFENKLSNIKEIDELRNELQKKNNILEFIEFNNNKHFLEKFVERDILIEKLHDLEHKFSNLKVRYQEKNCNYVKKYEEFLDAQAGILACKLKDNMACPVCGSLNHPKPAVLTESILTKEDIDNLKKELDIISKELDSKVIDINNLKKDIQFYDKELEIYDYDLLKEFINENEDKFNNNDYIVSEINRCDREVIEREKNKIEILIREKSINLENVDDIESVCNNIKNISVDISSLSMKINKLSDDYLTFGIEYIKYDTIISNLANDIVSFEKEYNIIDNRYQESYKKLGFNEESDYLNVMLEKQELNLLEEEIITYKNNVVELSSNIKSLEEFLGDKSIIDASDFVKEKNSLEDKKKQIDVSLKEINHKLVNNLNIYKKIDNVYSMFKKLEKELMVYKDLSDTANGNISGKNKLEFEQYVQANYFDRVIKAANKRFNYMTDERYLLMRKEESMKISDKLGLELQVLDNYTGKKRDVKSLSGGESFKAALSLALGMSDTIQEFSGGIVVDAMFIDEGFGNLDDDSLDSAMNAIMMLGQNNKIIGIISHVNELKQRIDKKIIVKKTNSGSSIEINV